MIVKTDEVTKTNGTLDENESCAANHPLEKLKLEGKSAHPTENGTESYNPESDEGSKDILNASKTDTDSLRTNSEKETSKEISKEPLSNELKRSIVENVLSRYVQEAKKLKTNVGNLIENKCNDVSNSSEINEVCPGSSTCKDTLSVKSQTPENKIVLEKVPVSDSKSPKALDLMPDSTEPAKLDKIDSETEKPNASDSNLNISDNDKENDLECPHLEPEAPMELEIAPPIIDCSPNIESGDDNSELLNNSSKDSLMVKNAQKDRSVEPDVRGAIKGKNMEAAIKSDNIVSSEKVIVYHEDTIRIVENSETSKLTCDKENSSEFNEIDKESATDVICIDTKLSGNKTVLETKKSAETVSNKPKGQKLDELLSKIATKATNDLNIPKKAKARKSFSQTAPAVEKAVVSSMSKTPASIANLTFNVKMLEKQGVLDIPKAQNKRKAFEPFKLKVKQSDNGEKSPAKVAVVKSPVKSPKKDSPFFNTSKVIKGRRRKKKKMGSYKLPSEKKQKPARDRKKASEERLISDDDKSDKNKYLVADSGMEITVVQDTPNTNNSAKASCTDTEQQSASPLSQTSAKSVDSKTGTDSRQHTTLDDLIKNSKLFTNTEKAKKSVRSGIEQGSQTRTLDAFLKRVSHLATTNNKVGKRIRVCCLNLYIVNVSVIFVL